MYYLCVTIRNIKPYCDIFRRLTNVSWCSPSILSPLLLFEGIFDLERWRFWKYRFEQVVNELDITDECKEVTGAGFRPIVMRYLTSSAANVVQNTKGMEGNNNE